MRELESQRLDHLANPTPTERIARFDYQTAFVSSMHGMRDHRDYKAMVAIGKEAIPLILSVLQERPTWMALALDGITSQDIVKTAYLESQGNIGIMVERALQWGEREGHIAIRGDIERRRKGQELFDSAKGVLLQIPEARDTLAENSFGPRPEEQAFQAEFDQNGDRMRVSYERDDWDFIGISETITIENLSRWVEIDIPYTLKVGIGHDRFAKAGDLPKYVYFTVDGAPDDSLPAYNIFKEVLAGPLDINPATVIIDAQTA